MKKRIFLLLSVIALAAIAMASPQGGDVVTGTGSGTGFGGPNAITVTLTLKDGVIVNAVAEGPKETQGIGSVAVEKMPAAMVSGNTIKVDGVSGATFSSKGILEAAEAALVAAGVNPKDYGAAPAAAQAPAETPKADVAAKAADETPKTDAAPVAASAQQGDGVVTGTGSGTGFGGPNAITVTVTLKDGVITNVTAEGPKETQGIGSVAVEKMPAAMVSGNTIKVDGISGATFSSKGILEAAEAALVAAGVDPKNYMDKAAAAKASDETYEADVTVIGGGGAGMVAAIAAADAGKSVILVEKQAMLGGNSVRSTGGMNATHTPEQDKNEFKENAGVEKTLKTAAEKWADNKAITDLAARVKEQWAAWQAAPKGYFDSVELMQLDTIIGGHGINNPALVETLCANTAESIEWLKTIGIDLTSVGAFGGASVKRIHRPLNDEGKVVSVGAYMVPRLEAACRSRKNITILTETAADTLLTDSAGNVAGIAATGKSGSKITIHSKAVVLATGGFGANLNMVSRLNPSLAGFMTTNAPGATGEGITMGQELGAAVVNMNRIQIHPTVQFDSAALITEGLRGDGAILVNSEGKRFIDETGTRDVVSAAEIAQPGSFSWLVIDQKMADASSVIKGYITRGFTVQGDDYAALAGAMGVPADAFADTMKKWNDCVASRSDAEFGRTSFAEALDKAPFYAIKVTAGIHHTMGGLKIDESARVLRGNGSVIPGLFAAGEITGGVHGGNRLGGNAVADFVVFGRIAGQAAANF